MQWKRLYKFLSFVIFETARILSSRWRCFNLCWGFLVIQVILLTTILFNPIFFPWHRMKYFLLYYLVSKLSYFDNLCITTVRVRSYTILGAVSHKELIWAHCCLHYLLMIYVTRWNGKNYFSLITKKYTKLFQP